MKLAENTIPTNVIKTMLSILTVTELIESIVNNGKTVTLYGQPFTNRKGEPILLDAQTFKSIGIGFFADRNNVYGLTYTRKSNSQKIYLTPIKNVDIDTFQSLSLYYAKDANQYYYAQGGKIIKEKNLVLFKDDYLNNKYPDRTTTNQWISEIALGNEFVYVRGRKLKNADPKTFRRPQQFYFTDKNSVYFKNGPSIKPILGVDMNSLIFFSKGFGTDKHKHLYAHESKQELTTYDFEFYRDDFEKLRGTISNDYWWYKMESGEVTKS